MKHLLSDFDLSKKEIVEITELAIEIKNNPDKFSQSLKGKILGMLFQKPSTRTKASFEAAMYQLGGNAIFLDNNNSQIGRGESLAETAKILSSYTNAIAARLSYQKDLEEMANASKVPVINALTDLYHPCQILADLLTIKENKGKLEGMKLAYFGDGGNNISHSLITACTKAGMDVFICSPAKEKYQPNPKILDRAKKESNLVVVTDNVEFAAKNADILYTDTWISMGMENEKQERIADLLPCQLNKEVLAMAKRDCVVMHCLPAYEGYEITKEVLKSKQSVIYQQAENRLHAQKALILWLLKDVT